MEEEEMQFADGGDFCFPLSLQMEVCNQTDESKGIWLRKGTFLTEDNSPAKN